MYDPPRLSQDTRRRLGVLADSYARFAGQALAAPGEDVVAALWRHPAAIVAHGIEADPVFFFGNQAALAAFEMALAHFTRLPSRLSAEPVARDERERLLARVRTEGMIQDYCGVRISASGRRFRIEQAKVWNLIDERGAYLGQAALFNRATPVE